MQTITLSIGIKASRTSISIPERDIEVEATDYLEVEVPKGNLNVDIQPGNDEALKLLVIKSSVYSSELEFTVNNGANDKSTVVQLDGPQIFSGGAMALFDVSEPKRLTFTNTITPETTAKVEIFVGRDATP